MAEGGDEGDLIPVSYEPIIPSSSAGMDRQVWEEGEKSRPGPGRESSLPGPGRRTFSGTVFYREISFPVQLSIAGSMSFGEALYTGIPGLSVPFS